MPRITQKERVLQHLKERGHITSWEAIKEYGCTRLADVIFRLKDEYSIATQMQDSTNRFGDKVRYAKYVFVGEKILN
jgi:ribosomal protein S8